MLEHVEAWLLERHLPPGARVLDAGCGTGLCSVLLAKHGYTVTAIDIAPQMVKAAQQRAQTLGVAERITFVAGDLEIVSGQYDAVVCLDVLIHYPQPGFAEMCTRLASLSRGPFIMTYAPYNSLLASLHWVGGHFPRSERRTDIQMIPDGEVRRILTEAGMEVRRSVRVSRGFYHVALLEAGRG
jgi:magnesium-protoporphyrin O-methyltransferase